MCKMLFKQIAKHYLETPLEQQGEYVILQRQQKKIFNSNLCDVKIGSME